MSDQNQAYTDDGIVYLEHPDECEPIEIATFEELRTGISESETEVRDAIDSLAVDDESARWVEEKGKHVFIGFISSELREITGKTPEGYLYLRVFPTEDPTNSVRGVIHLEKNPEWHAQLLWECPERFTSAVNQYMAALRENGLCEDGPPAQLVVSGCVVVAENIEFKIPADELEIEFVVNPVDQKTGADAQRDIETGVTAQGTYSTERIATATQRAGDVLDYDFEWLTVITPDDLSGLGRGSKSSL